MLVKILGTIDVISGLILIFSIMTYIPDKIFLILGLILIVKSSLGMLKDFASWVDLLTGIIFLLLMIVSIPQFVIFIFAFLIVQKGIFSFL